VTVRQQRGIVDRDLAAIYGVQTRASNQAVKRNPDRFPEEFMFSLTRADMVSLSQSVTALRSLEFSRRARVFTEHGALMAATVLNSPRAVKMSLFIIRAFVKLREDQAANAAIFRRTHSTAGSRSESPDTITIKSVSPRKASSSRLTAMFTSVFFPPAPGIQDGAYNQQPGR
jgi:hypothetical protein